MANLDKTGIETGQDAEASQVTNLYDILTGDATYDNLVIMVVISGVLRMIGTYDCDFLIGSPQKDDDGDAGHDSRMFFDKAKKAFRVGSVRNDQWDQANIGTNSYAEGGDNMANGAYSHAEGRLSTASGDYSHAEGRGSIASGNCSHAEGYSTAANGDYSHAEGISSVARLRGQHTHATGYSSFEGDCQNSKFQLRGSTTDATLTELTTPEHFSLEDEYSYACTITIHARQDTGANHAMYKRMCIIERTGGTVVLAGTVQTIGTDIETDAAWDVAITADDTNKSLKITVTGGSSQNIRWTALIETVELGYSD